jgi:hypothetical protein
MFKFIKEIISKLFNTNGISERLEDYVIRNNPQSHADIERLVTEFHRKSHY